jgi:periplasmic divalent cation tolerance protein
MSEILVYMTAAGEKEAEAVAEHIISKRLAACVNILPGMRSMYYWDGAVQKDREVVLIAKTRKELLDALTTAVKEVHSYEVPCIVALDLVGGNPEFLTWIHDETRKP